MALSLGLYCFQTDSMKKFLRFLIILFVVLLAVYLAGPSPEAPDYNKALQEMPADPVQLDAYVKTMESGRKLKPDNEARIIWLNDSLKDQTEYAIVYLHGFTASQEEGDPVHEAIAKKYGCNLYLSRLSEHGLDTAENMINLTADSYYASAVEALSIGRKLGSKIILMATSTGGTLALKLAEKFPNDVQALILMSPNIAVNDGTAFLLNNHWGKQIAKMAVGSEYLGTDPDSIPEVPKYWTRNYRIEAAVAMEELVETSMTEKTFKAVKQPLLLMYWYKIETEQDDVVKVDAMLDMFDALGTPADKKQKHAIPEAGNHVIGSKLRSGDVASVMKYTEGFMENVLQLKPLP